MSESLETLIESSIEPNSKETLLREFDEFLQNNPPINGGVFSPKEELDRIRSLPSEQKKEELVIFKENLSKQRKAWATCRIFIERSIESNHDVLRNELTRWIQKFANQYGFSEEQISIAEYVVDGYYSNRKKVLEIRGEFPDDNELIKELTGVTLEVGANVDVAVGPMTIDINASKSDVIKLYNNAHNPVAGFYLGGFASKSKGEDPVCYIVINRDQENLVSQRTKAHEYEHQKNKLFREVFEYQDTEKI